MKILFTFLTENKICFGSIRSCLLNFHRQIIMISSQNNVRKYNTKGHEIYSQHLYYVSIFVGKPVDQEIM